METLTKFNGVVGQVSGIDKAYRFIIYTLRIVAATTAKRYGPENELVKRIANLTAPLADTRMALRLFGLIPILQQFYRLHIATTNSKAQASTPTKDRLLQEIEKLQLYSMLIYYPAEHCYWLGVHKVLNIQDPDRWSRWSCRAWAAYIILDIVAVAYQLQPLQAKLKELKSNTSSEAVSTRSKLESDLEDFRLQLAGLLTDLPLAIHWSLASYPLSNTMVGVFGVISTVASSMLKWKYS